MHLTQMLPYQKINVMSELLPLQRRYIGVIHEAEHQIYCVLEGKLVHKTTFRHSNMPVTGPFLVLSLEEVLLHYFLN